ncbi:MAG: cupin domain-containing protein [Acidimicrobiales bacterium]
MGVRRVTTGHDDAGRAVVASDEAVEAITLALVPGWEFHRLWGADEAGSFPDSGERPSAPAYFPPRAGSRFAFFTVPAHNGPGVPDDVDLVGALGEFDEKLPGMSEHLEVENPGMHTTATIDYGVVVSGEATLELDDGVIVVLRPGDTYVQNGTRHRWRNHGDVPAVVAVVLIGADHQRVV